MEFSYLTGRNIYRSQRAQTMTKLNDTREWNSLGKERRLSLFNRKYKQDSFPCIYDEIVNMHALCLNFNMHAPVTLYIQFRLYFVFWFE